MINFLALIGWHPKGDKEVLSRDELIAEFDIDRVQQSGAIFNEEKLDWLNREHMKSMPVAEVAELAAPFFAKHDIVVKNDELLKRVVAVQIARAKTLDDIAQSSGFFFAMPDYEPKLLIWKDSSTLKEVAEVLAGARAVIAGVAADDFTRETLTACCRSWWGIRAGGSSSGRCAWRSPARPTHPIRSRSCPCSAARNPSAASTKRSKKPKRKVL